jgi:F-type H+-transporting ATPase subunit a
MTVSFHADGGFQAPATDVFQPKHWFDARLGPIDLYLNKATGLTIFSAVFVGVVFWLGFRRPQIVPRGVQNVCELVHDLVDQQVARAVIGEEGGRYTPYLIVLFCFTLTCNLLGIIPVAQFPATSRIAVPMLLAIITLVLFNHAGIRAHGARAYFAEMIDPAPLAPPWIKFLLAPLEVVHMLVIRPFTLAIRLFANMFAGHMLLLIFTLGGTYLLPKPPYIFGATSLLVAITLTGFETVIAVLQAYVITILTAAYIAGARASTHDTEASG